VPSPIWSLAALEQAGYRVAVLRPPEANQGEFARLGATSGEQTMYLDLARDWRRWPPVHLELGPVLHLDDAVSSKVTAMVSRRLPRDRHLTARAKPPTSGSRQPR
jgi:hypothetical protein